MALKNAVIVQNDNGTLTSIQIDSAATVSRTPLVVDSSGNLGGVATNLTGTASGLTSGITAAIKSATTTVDVSASAAPAVGAVLTATSSTTATWQAAAAGGGGGVTSLNGQTGAVVDTSSGAIGSFFVGVTTVTGAMNPSSTVAGSTLRGSNTIGDPFKLVTTQGAGISGTNPGYSGTWRACTYSSGTNYTSYVDSYNGLTYYNYYFPPNLWVRIS